MKKRIHHMIIVMLAVVVLLGVGAFPVSAASASLKLNKTKASIQVGKTIRLKATVKNTKKKIKWTSSNKAIATVSAKGVVRVKKAGKVTITAKCGSLKKICRITVKDSRKKAVAAYANAIRGLSWGTAVFAVTDIDGDGVYEVIVEDIVRDGTSFHPERKGVLLYYNGGLKKYSYGPAIETMGPINSNRQILLERTRGKAIETVLSFSPSKGVKEVTSFFLPYLTETEAAKLQKKYLSGLKYLVYKPVTEANLKTYLSGKGKPTGTSTNWVGNGLSNND